MLETVRFYLSENSLWPLILFSNFLPFGLKDGKDNDNVLDQFRIFIEIKFNEEV